MELGGFEPPTFWVRSSGIPTGPPGHLDVEALAALDLRSLNALDPRWRWAAKTTIWI